MGRSTARKPASTAHETTTVAKARSEIFSSSNTGNGVDVLNYIADITEELAQLAGSMNENSLAYFLTMARAEAELLSLKRRRN